MSVTRVGKTSRQLSKSKQTKAAVGTFNKRPSPSEGTDGDIRISMTTDGPKLYAKIGTKWYTTALVEAAKESASVKMSHIKGQLNPGTSDIISLPASIPSGSVTGILFFSNHSADWWHVYNWADLSDDAEAGPYVTRHRVIYERSGHYIRVDRRGTQADGAKPYRAIIFYT